MGPELTRSENAERAEELNLLYAEARSYVMGAPGFRVTPEEPYFAIACSIDRPSIELSQEQLKFLRFPTSVANLNGNNEFPEKATLTTVYREYRKGEQGLVFKREIKLPEKMAIALNIEVPENMSTSKYLVLMTEIGGLNPNQYLYAKLMSTLYKPMVGNTESLVILRRLSVSDIAFFRQAVSSASEINAPLPNWEDVTVNV